MQQARYKGEIARHPRCRSSPVGIARGRLVIEVACFAEFMVNTGYFG